MVMSIQYSISKRAPKSRLPVTLIGLLVSCLAAPSVSARGDYIDFLIESEGSFVEYLYDSQADAPHDMPKCRPYIEAR
jgi:hypothetical protein